VKNNLDRLLTSMSENIYETSCIMVELERRGELDEGKCQGPFKWFNAIARGQLDPMCAVMFWGDGLRICVLLGSSLRRQRKLAEGGAVTIAALSETGEIVPKDVPFASLTDDEIVRAWDIDALPALLPCKARSERGIRIGERLFDPETDEVRADFGANELVITSSVIAETRMPMEGRLLEAMENLGFTITKVPAPLRLVAPA